MNLSSRSRKLALIGFVLMLTSSAQFIADTVDFSEFDGAATEATLFQQTSSGLYHNDHTVTGPCDSHAKPVIAFPAELLAGLAPSDVEAAAYYKNRTGWHRTIPVSGGSTLDVVVNHYNERNGNLFVRAQLDGDDLSLLTMVVAGAYVKGHLVVPGEAGYEVTNSGETVYLRPLNDVDWSCGHG
jgi:hypothetical protein